MFRRASGLLLALAALAVAAQPPPARPVPATKIAAPRGPIKITAERAELERRETALYRGNVTLASPDLTMTGDRLELRQPARGQVKATLTGKPARLNHKGAGDAPEIAASASQIVYDMQSGIIELTGGARLDRGADVLTSQQIRYELAARRISATGVGAGQVQLVIQPPGPPSGPPKPQNTPAAPGDTPKK